DRRRSMQGLPSRRRRSPLAWPPPERRAESREPPREERAPRRRNRVPSSFGPTSLDARTIAAPRLGPILGPCETRDRRAPVCQEALVEPSSRTRTGARSARLATHYRTAPAERKPSSRGLRGPRVPPSRSFGRCSPAPSSAVSTVEMRLELLYNGDRFEEGSGCPPLLRALGARRRVETSTQTRLARTRNSGQGGDRAAIATSRLPAEGVAHETFLRPEGRKEST